MILELSAETRRSVADYQSFKARATRLKAIQSTGNALSELESSLTALQIYPHLRAYFAPETDAELRRVAGGFVAALQELYDKFPDKLDQQGSLAHQKRQAAALKDRVTEAWRAYALPQVDDLYRRYTLVERLPKIQKNAAVFEQAIRRLRTAVNDLPSEAATIDSFHAELQKIGNQLDQVGDLTESQRTFLMRVNAGSATLSEVTPELLVWIKAQDMDSRIKLSIET